MRAIETGQPLADKLRLPLEVDDRLAEYDRDLPHYIPVEQIAKENAQELQRLLEGRLPSGVDEAAFRARITVLNITLAWEEPATIEALIDPLAQRVPIPA